MEDATDSEPSGGPPRGPALRGDELLMRRMLFKNKQYDPKFKPPILAGTFHPRKSDRDGLSMSRRHSETFPDFLTAEQMKAACAVQSSRDRAECGVCAVGVASVRAIGLTITSSPTGTDPGHAHLEQINYDDFEGTDATDESFARVVVWVQQLVLLGCEHILIVPGPAPGKEPV